MTVSARTATLRSPIRTTREAALEFKKEVEERFPDADIYLAPLSLSIACHIGPGSLALTATERWKRNMRKIRGTDPGDLPEYAMSVKLPLIILTVLFCMIPLLVESRILARSSRQEQVERRIIDNPEPVSDPEQ